MSIVLKTFCLFLQGRNNSAVYSQRNVFMFAAAGLMLLKYVAFGLFPGSL